MNGSRDIAGKKFNMLTVIKDTGKGDKYYNHLWECLCDCGNTTITTTTAIKNGHTKSCGCLVGEAIKLPKGEAAFNNLYSRYKGSAKRRKHEFTLSKDEFREITKQQCHYCGVEPKQEHTAGNIPNGSYIFNGIGRVDNTQGYTEDNCLPCCYDCNTLKATRTKEDFLNQISKIYEHNISIVY